MLSPTDATKKNSTQRGHSKHRLVRETCSFCNHSMHGQAFRPEAHRQKLLQSEHCRLSIFVIHQDGHRRLESQSCQLITSNGILFAIFPQPYPPLGLTSQNSRIYCLHIPQGLAGGEMSVATARARMSPLRAPSTTAVPRAVRSAQVPTG